MNQTCEILTLPNCTIPISYIQPDKGVALIPWIYTVILLTVHLPLIIIKVAKWETGQLLSLALCFFAVGLTILSYHSTKLDPAQVYIWTPVTLTIDVGALLQIMALILEDRRKKRAIKEMLRGLKEKLWKKKDRTPTIKREEGQASSGVGSGVELPEINRSSVNSDAQAPLLNAAEAVVMEPPEIGPSASTAAVLPPPALVPPQFRNRNIPRQESQVPDPGNQRIARVGTLPVDENKNAKFYIFVLLTSLVMCIALLVLQIIGLVFALKGYHERNNFDLRQSWCSPAFLLGNQVVDLTCQNYTVTSHWSYTLGCIKVPGDYADWLIGSGLVILAQLACQLLDAVCLFLTHSDLHFNHGVKVRRPWTTAILGTAVYAFLITLSIIKTQKNPIPTGDTVAIMNGVSCRTNVYASGLRGAIIAWSDGVFAGWGMQYFGFAPTGS